MDNRIITTDVMEEDFSLEGNLRPQTLDEYIGQEKPKYLKSIILKLPNSVTIPWIMSFSMALRDLEKLPFPVLLPMKWVCI